MNAPLIAISTSQYKSLLYVIGPILLVQRCGNLPLVLKDFLIFHPLLGPPFPLRSGALLIHPVAETWADSRIPENQR